MSFKILVLEDYRDVESVSFVREHFEIRLFSLVEISFFRVSAFVLRFIVLLVSIV